MVPWPFSATIRNPNWEWHPSPKDQVIFHNRRVRNRNLAHKSKSLPKTGTKSYRQADPPSWRWQVWGRHPLVSRQRGPPRKQNSSRKATAPVGGVACFMWQSRLQSPPTTSPLLPFPLLPARSWREKGIGRLLLLPSAWGRLFSYHFSVCLH